MHEKHIARRDADNHGFSVSKFKIRYACDMVGRTFTDKKPRMSGLYMLIQINEVKIYKRHINKEQVHKKVARYIPIQMNEIKDCKVHINKK